MSSLLTANPYASPAEDASPGEGTPEDRRLELGLAERGLDCLLAGWACIVASAIGAILLAMFELDRDRVLCYSALFCLVLGTGFHLGGGICFVAARDSLAFRGWGLGCGLGLMGMATLFLADYVSSLSGNFGLSVGSTLLIAGCLAQASVLRRIASLLKENTLNGMAIVLLFLWGAAFLVAFARLFAAGPFAHLPLFGSSIYGLTEPLDQRLATFVFLGFLLGLVGTIAVTYLVRTALRECKRRRLEPAEAEIV